MHTVDLIASFFLELLIKQTKCNMVDLMGFPARATDEMVVSMFGHLIHQLTITDVGRQHQTLLGQEIEGPINSCLGQPRHEQMSTLANLHRGKMPARIVEHLKDHHPLGRHAVASSVQMRCILLEHAVIPYCKNLQQRIISKPRNVVKF